MCTASQSGFRRGDRPLAVDWQDCGWCPLIAVQLPVAATPRRRAINPLPLPQRRTLSRHDPLFFKTMKNLTINRGKCQVPSARQEGTPRQVHSCHVSRATLAAPKRSEGGRAAFTLVELLTVIAIIAILAAMLLTALAGVKAHALKVQAHLQTEQIENAIEKYDSDYGRFPVSTNAQFAASAAGGDYTYGGIFSTPTGPYSVQTYPASGVVVSNAEVIAILMDNTNLANGVNAGHIKNPRQTIFLTAKMSGYDPLVPGQPEGGVDVNGVYRDPWGNPYVITMDLNYDENCRDSFYCLKAVSQSNGQTGYNGLVNTDPGGNTDNFQYHGGAMVWSVGANGKIDPLDPANDRENRDNVLSWQ